MSRLKATSELLKLDSILGHFAVLEDVLGEVPNMYKAMAASPSCLEAYINLASDMRSNCISESLAQQIWLTVSEANRCDYCIAHHSAVAKTIGLTDDQIRDARQGTSPSRTTETVLRFARQIVDKRGQVSDGDMKSVKIAGLSDEAIADVVAHVCLAIFGNYFNLIARPDMDFRIP